MDGDEPKELPFERKLDPTWAATVDHWQWNPRDDGTYAKAGACPRCGHGIGFVERTTGFAHMTTARTLETKGKRFEACNCGVAHPGVPEGEGGCGAGGQILRANP